MSERDGGPAFPVDVFIAGKFLPDMDGTPCKEMDRMEHHQGMSLRDAFAIGALQRMLPFDSAGNITMDSTYARDIARTAFAVADALLAERERK